MGVATTYAVGDLLGSVQRMPLALTLALDDLAGKYRRTALGPLWITVGQAATIAGFVLVFSVLFQMRPEDYAIYLAAGFPVWMLISQFLSDMPATFIAARPLIESYQLPWITHIWRRSIGYMLAFAHQIVILFAVMLFLRVPFTVEMLYVIPALAILFVAGSGLGVILAILGARYRDVQPAMTVASGFLFLFTPVMWRAEQLHLNKWAVQFNPVYYYIKIIRDPLLGYPVAPELWLGASIGAVVIFVVGFLAFVLVRRRLYHWL